MTTKNNPNRAGGVLGVCVWVCKCLTNRVCLIEFGGFMLLTQQIIKDLKWRKINNMEKTNKKTTTNKSSQMENGLDL